MTNKIISVLLCVSCVFSVVGLEGYFMLLGIKNGQLFTDSLLVIHQGELVYERHAGGWDMDTPHQMYSVTKSVVSALVGVAILDEKIESVQQKAIEFFEDDVTIAPGQESKREITIEQLLRSTSGLPGDSDNGAHVEWWTAEDSGVAAFETPQVAAPGERFAYSSGPGLQTLACLISRAVEDNLFEYAKRKLFEPLGMSSVIWDSADDGNNYGGFGLQMSARDMMRLGLLYLNNGCWDGGQLIPAAYIEASQPPPGDPDSYGYTFWNFTKLSRYDSAYMASGSFGQLICIMPEQDIVFVRTGSAGPMTSFVSGAAYENAIADFFLMGLIFPFLPLQGIPIDYFRASL
ncbi:MAG: beta-lactamase family protein [Oscillospiraceae bacterium]|nr:beta-lactamase family protein [Oscillospiraceae bacterium]